MLDKIVVGTGLILISLSYSCKPIYKCGEEFTDKKYTKRVQAVVSERDSLCSDLSNKISDNIKLNEDLAASIQENSNLNSKYNQLISDKLNDQNLYNSALSKKNAELNEKERLLQDREQALKEMQRIISRQDSITRRLNDVLRNALLGFNSDELSVDIKDGKVYVSMSDKLLFKSGSVTIEDKGIGAIHKLAEVLNKNLDIDILIEGHTDNIPIKTAIYKDNWDLSVGRATSIVRILTVENNISSTRVTASGKGEFYPRESNDTAEGRAKNRRTEIILSPKLDEIMNLLNSK